MTVTTWSVARTPYLQRLDRATAALPSTNSPGNAVERDRKWENRCRAVCLLARRQGMVSGCADRDLVNDDEAGESDGGVEVAPVGVGAEGGVGKANTAD